MACSGNGRNEKKRSSINFQKIIISKLHLGKVYKCNSINLQSSPAHNHSHPHLEQLAPLFTISYNLGLDLIVNNKLAREKTSLFLFQTSEAIKAKSELQIKREFVPEKYNKKRPPFLGALLFCFSISMGLMMLREGCTKKNAKCFRLDNVQLCKIQI